MTIGDNRKVEDALQAIKSLVEASGIDASEDDGTIRLDSIVWRGSLAPESDEVDKGLIALNPLERPLNSDALEQQAEAPFSSPVGKLSEDAPATYHLDTGIHSSLDTQDGQLGNDNSGASNMSDGNTDRRGDEGWVAFRQSDRLSAYDNVSQQDVNEAQSIPAYDAGDNLPSAIQDNPAQYSAAHLNQQAALEIEETRALLAEFQNLLDSTIALKQAAEQKQVDSQDNDKVRDAGDDTHLSDLAKIALNARMSLTNGLSQSANDTDSNQNTTAEIDKDVQIRQAEATAQDSLSDNFRDDVPTDELSKAGSDSDSQKLSNIALHLVDVADRTEPEYKSLFTSAVRSTMQDIIRRQMTEWLAANMTDIIEDALRDELQPAKSKHQNPTNRRDQNS